MNDYELEIPCVGAVAGAVVDRDVAADVSVLDVGGVLAGGLGDGDVARDLVETRGRGLGLHVAIGTADAVVDVHVAADLEIAQEDVVEADGIGDHELIRQPEMCGGEGVAPVSSLEKHAGQLGDIDVHAVVAGLHVENDLVHAPVGSASWPSSSRTSNCPSCSRSTSCASGCSTGSQRCNCSKLRRICSGRTPAWANSHKVLAQVRWDTPRALTQFTRHQRLRLGPEDRLFQLGKASPTSYLSLSYV
jgi:hypothetical protein